MVPRAALSSVAAGSGKCIGNNRRQRSGGNCHKGSHAGIEECPLGAVGAGRVARLQAARLKGPAKAGPISFTSSANCSGDQQRVIVISRVPPLSDGTILISLLF